MYNPWINQNSVEFLIQKRGKYIAAIESTVNQRAYQALYQTIQGIDKEIRQLLTPALVKQEYTSDGNGTKSPSDSDSASIFSRKTIENPLIFNQENILKVEVGNTIL